MFVKVGDGTPFSSKTPAWAGGRLNCVWGSIWRAPGLHLGTNKDQDSVRYGPRQRQFRMKMVLCWPKVRLSTFLNPRSDAAKNSAPPGPPQKLDNRLARSCTHCHTHFVPRSQTHVKNGAKNKNPNFQGCGGDTVPQTLTTFSGMFSCQCLIPVLFLLSVPRASAFVDILSLIHFSLSLLLFLTPMP